MVFFLRRSLCSNLGSFLEISLEYFVFFSSVEICIYMFNKTQSDLLCELLFGLFWCQWRTAETAERRVIHARLLCAGEAAD